MSYFAQLLQNVIVSSGNSSTDPLDGGATFTGPSTLPTAQSTLGVSGIQVNLKASQNCTVYVDQSMDGSNWDITDTLNYYYSIGGHSWTVQATASYVRVRVKNLNASVAANPFRLQTALCPIVEAIPRSLSEEGNLKVGVYEIEGDFGTCVAVTPMHALRVAEAIRLVGSTFGASFDTNFWTKTLNTGTSTSDVANDVLTLSTNPTGSGSGNSAIVNSVRAARYVSGKSNTLRMQIRTPTVVGANTRRWGAFDSSNGFYFSWDGTTFKVGCRKSWVDTEVSSGSFNGKQGSSYSPTANVTTYEITWTNKIIWFSVDDVILHKFTATTARLTNTSTLRIGLENTNGANTSNNTLECWVASISRNGNLLTQPMSARISTVSVTTCKVGAGNLHAIVFGQQPTATCTINIYDNTTNSGSIIAKFVVSRSSTASTPVTIPMCGIPFSNGLTVEMLTNASDIVVVYE